MHGVAEFVEYENAYGRQVSSAFFLIPKAIAPRSKALENAHASSPLIRIQFPRKPCLRDEAELAEHESAHEL